MEQARSAFDLLSEWIANDQPVEAAARDVVTLNRGIRGDYGAGLRGLVWDIHMDPGMYPMLVSSSGHPGDSGFSAWTLGRIDGESLHAVDWTKLADTLFPVGE